MLTFLRDRRDALELIRQIQDSATRHLRGTSDPGYLEHDLETIDTKATELRRLLERLLSGDEVDPPSSLLNIDRKGQE